MSRKIIFRAFTGFAFIAFVFALPSVGIDFSQEPTRLGEGQTSTTAFNPDGTLLAAAHRTDPDSDIYSTQVIILWDPQTQEQMSILEIENIQYLTFSPDGSLLALGGADNTIRLWDVAGQNQVGLIQSPTRWGLYCLAFSPDGKTLASSGSGSTVGSTVVCLWDVQTKQQLGTLRGHRGQGIHSIAFSPDGRLLVSGGAREDEAIRVWDVETQQQVGELIGHLDVTYDLAFNPDGTILASAGGWNDKAIYLWDTKTWEQMGVLGGHSAHVTSIAFSPNGELLASTVNWDHTIHFWDVEKQEEVGIFVDHYAMSSGTISHVAFSLDGKWLACGSDNGVELWELNLPGAIPRTNAFGPKPYDETLLTDTWVNLEWKAGDFAVSHDVYFSDNFDDVNDSAADAFQGNHPTDFFFVGFAPNPYPDGLIPGTTYYWRIDEVNDADPNSPWKGPVWSFTIQPKIAFHPIPADGADSVDLNVELSWTAGSGTALHTVYFGNNFDDVNNASVGLKQVATTYTPGPLEFAKTYYWRIDELSGGRGAGMHKGDIWNFTTIDFIVVDDFEDYDIGNNEIWWSWKDGLGYVAHDNEPAYYGNGTGSIVGNENTNSYCEETIVHRGKQSMPLAYDNNKQGYANYSEVEMTLGELRNWTVGGLGVLTIWFHGAASNSAEPMYVILNDNASVTHDNPKAAQIENWTHWDIDLQEFSDQGVDMTDVHTIGLGFGNRNNPQPGGSGKMYFDDIQLRK